MDRPERELFHCYKVGPLWAQVFYNDLFDHLGPYWVPFSPILSSCSLKTPDTTKSECLPYVILKETWNIETYSNSAALSLFGQFKFNRSVMQKLLVECMFLLRIQLCHNYIQFWVPILVDKSLDWWFSPYLMKYWVPNSMLGGPSISWEQCYIRSAEFLKQCVPAWVRWAFVGGWAVCRSLLGRTQTHLGPGIWRRPSSPGGMP